MKVVVGLGNPEENLARSRHNVGFIVLDMVREAFHMPEFTFDAMFNADVSKADDMLLVKPMTHMNDSGGAVAKILNFYKCTPSEMIVIHDDMDFPSGTVVKVFERGPAGHNGVRSIIEALGGDKGFYRIRVGIGRPQGNMEMHAYVLGPLGEDLQKIVDKKEEIVTAVKVLP